MKIVTKFAFATLLAIAAAAPALAFEAESQTLEERNEYLFTSDAHAIAQHQNAVRAQDGTEAFAYAPAQAERHSNGERNRTVDSTIDYDYSVFRGY